MEYRTIIQCNIYINSFDENWTKAFTKCIGFNWKSTLNIPENHNRNSILVFSKYKKTRFRDFAPGHLISVSAGDYAPFIKHEREDRLVHVTTFKKDPCLLMVYPKYYIFMEEPKISAEGFMRKNNKNNNLGFLPHVERTASWDLQFTQTTRPLYIRDKLQTQL